MCNFSPFFRLVQFQTPQKSSPPQCPFACPKVTECSHKENRSERILLSVSLLLDGALSQISNRGFVEGPDKAKNLLADFLPEVLPRSNDINLTNAFLEGPPVREWGNGGGTSHMYDPQYCNVVIPLAPI